MPMIQFRTVGVVGRRGDDFWVETADEFGGMASGRGMVRKLLVPFGAIEERAGGEAYVMSPDSAVRRQTLLRAGGRPGGAPHLPRGLDAGRRGSGAGRARASLRAVHWRRGNAELWTSAEAGPLGLVRYRSPDLEIAPKGTSSLRTIPRPEAIPPNSSAVSTQKSSPRRPTTPTERNWIIGIPPPRFSLTL